VEQLLEAELLLESVLLLEMVLLLEVVLQLVEKEGRHHLWPPLWHP